MPEMKPLSENVSSPQSNTTLQDLFAKSDDVCMVSAENASSGERQYVPPVSPAEEEEFTVYCFPLKGAMPKLTPAVFLGACGNYPYNYPIPLDKNGEPEWSIKFGANAVKTSPQGETEKIYLEFSQIFGSLPPRDGARYLAYELGKILGLDFVMFQTTSGKVGRIYTNPQAGPVGREDIIQTHLMGDASEWSVVLEQLVGGTWQVESHPLLGSRWDPPSGFYERGVREKLSRTIRSGMKNIARYFDKNPDDSNEFIYDGEVNPVLVYKQMASSGKFTDFFASGGPFYCTVLENDQPNYADKLRFLGSVLYQAGLVFLEAKRSGQDAQTFVFAKNLLFGRDEDSLCNLFCECKKFLGLQFFVRLSSFPSTSAGFIPLSLTLPAMGFDGTLLRKRIYARDESFFDFDNLMDFESETFGNKCD